MNVPWIGVKLDGTLAIYTKWRGATHIGEPVVPMLKKVIELLDTGQAVKIFTDRVYGNGDEAQASRLAIETWCEKHVGQVLPITCEEDAHMLLLYHNKCQKVETNTGRILG